MCVSSTFQQSQNFYNNRDESVILSLPTTSQLVHVAL